MQKAVFFDDGVGPLSPMTDLRPVFAVRTGAMTTRARLTQMLGLDVVALWVQPGHLAMAKSRAGEVPINSITNATGPVLLLNGRCLLPPPELRTLMPGEWLADEETGTCVAALLRPEYAEELLKLECDPSAHGWYNRAKKDSWASRRRVIKGAKLISRPWHVRALRDETIAVDLELLMAGSPKGNLPTGVLVIGSGGVSTRPGAKVYPGVILDTGGGPIVIDEGAVVRPGSTIIGPAYVGAGSSVLDRAVIKANTAIGPQCKVAGEVGGTIFHGFANKAHDGHLGDSWVGKWANLGAGTTNSNLLNTYDQVTMRATSDSPLEKTGQQFMGAIIGDHCKTAICTRIMTGAVLCTGVMYAATEAASGTIPRFAWCTDTGRTTFRLDKFTTIAQTVMARRKVSPGEAYTARLAELHALTQRGH